MKTSKRQGQTLVEVVVATMIAAMTSTAVFSVVLSSSVSGGRSDRKEAAVLAMNAVSEQLKLYVSAEPASGTYAPNNGILKDPLNNTIDTSGLLALQQSPSHTIDPVYLTTAFPALSGANPVMTYKVTNVVGCGGNTDATACKEVEFTITYDD